MIMGPASYVERSRSDKRHYENMRKIIVTFGLISGAISSLMMIALVTFGGRIGFDRGAIIGNTSIVLSFLMVFVGIRTCRDNIGDGQITVLKAFAVGLSITLISCIIYVVTWEVIYYNFLPGFLGRIWRSFGSEAHRLGGEPVSRPGKTSAGQKIQRAVQKPILQCSPHFHSSLPDWARHHAVLRVGPEAKAATATRMFTLAGILKLFRRLRPRVVGHS